MNENGQFVDINDERIDDVVARTLQEEALRQTQTPENVPHDVRLVEAGSVLASIRGADGSRVSYDNIKPTDIVTYNGADVPVAFALRYGIIERTLEGGYRDADPAIAAERVAKVTGQDRQQAEPEVPSPFLDGTHTRVTNIMNALAANGLPAERLVSEVILGNGTPPATLMHLARITGQPEHAVSMLYADLAADMQVQLMAFFTDCGLGSDQMGEFVEYMDRPENKTRLVGASIRALMGRDGTDLRDFVHGFLRHKGFGRGSAKVARTVWNPNTQANEDIVRLRVNGQEIETNVATARRMGLI